MLRRGILTATLLAGSLLAGSGLRAQELAPADTVALSVEGAVDLALVANEQTRIARAQVDRTEGIVREAFARALPSIDGSYRMTRNLQRPVIFFDQDGQIQQITIGSANEHSFGVTVQQPLFDRGLGAALRAARHGNAASEALYGRALSDVALDTRVAYYDVLRARARVIVSEGEIALVEARLRQVQLFFDVGTAAEFDLLTAQVAVENVRPAVISARNELDLTRNALKRVAGLPLDAPIVLTDTLAYVPVTITLEDATARALQNREDLDATRELMDVADHLVTVERAEGWPTLDLLLDVSRRASSEDFLPEDREYSQSAFAALALDIPLFDGRRAQGRVLQARADAVAASERLHALERDVRLQVLDAWQSERAAAESVEATRATVERARRAYDIAAVRFRNGLSTQLELDESEQNLVVAQSNAAEALYLHMTAAARLRHAMGER